MSFKFCDENPNAKSPGIFHVGAGGRVALQTARAVIRGEVYPYRVRVFFDAGSHRSFITSRAVQRRHWRGISTFGQRCKDMCLRDVVDMVIQMEAYVVPEISNIQNGHLGLVKGGYPHLKVPME